LKGKKNLSKYKQWRKTKGYLFLVLSQKHRGCREFVQVEDSPYGHATSTHQVGPNHCIFQELPKKQRQLKFFLFFNSIIQKKMSANGPRTRRELRIAASVNAKIDAVFPQAVQQRLTNAVNEASPEIYGKYPAELVLKIFLYWLVSDDSYIKLERLTKFPHSNVKQGFGSIRNAVLPVCRSYITPGTFQDRQRIALEEIDDPEFQDITGILDGVHVPFECALSADERKEFASHKLNWKPALNFMVVTNLENRICYVSTGHPARRHDITTFRDCAPVLKRKLADNDKLLADSGFIGRLPDDGQVSLVKPHKKPKNGELTETQTDFNTRLASIRSKIERVFGRLKNTFKVLQGFRGHSARLNEIFVVCCGLYNMILEHNQNQQNPDPQLANENPEPGAQ
jgi:hypothetical protein